MAGSWWLELRGGVGTPPDAPHLRVGWVGRRPSRRSEVVGRTAPAALYVGSFDRPLDQRAGRTSRQAGGPPRDVAARTPRTTASATQSAAARPRTSSGTLGAAPVERQKSVSPSTVVWGGDSVAASPRWARPARRVASSLVRRAS